MHRVARRTHLLPVTRQRARRRSHTLHACSACMYERLPTPAHTSAALALEDYGGAASVNLQTRLYFYRCGGTGSRAALRFSALTFHPPSRRSVFMMHPFLPSAVCVQTCGCDSVFVHKHLSGVRSPIPPFSRLLTRRMFVLSHATHAHTRSKVK